MNNAPKYNTTTTRIQGKSCKPYSKHESVKYKLWKRHNEPIPLSTRRVRFAETSTIVLTRPKSSHELRAQWYTKYEMKRFKDNVNNSVKSVLTNDLSVANQYIKNTIVGSNYNVQQFKGVENVRGIEHALSPQVCRALVAARSKTIKDVLDEQACQKAKGERDADTIAAISMQTSLFPTLWRHRIAEINTTDEPEM